MFSKAIYDPAKACAVEGLVETCIPGRYTPRKVVVARKIQEASLTTTAVLHDDAPTPRPGQETSNGGGSGGAGVDLRGSSSPASLGTVFRVVPNGIGKHSILPGRGGATATGIAPLKHLSGSYSTPTFVNRGSKDGEGLESPGTGIGSPSPNCSLVRSSSSRGRGSSESTFAKRLHAVTGAVNMAHVRGDCDGANGSGSTGGGSGRGSRGLTRSQSDFENGGRTGGWERGSTSGKRAGFVHDPSSASCGQQCNAQSDTNSTQFGYSRSRGASPAQRRTDEQLALDLAAVRSL